MTDEIGTEILYGTANLATQAIQNGK